MSAPLFILLLALAAAALVWTAWDFVRDLLTAIDPEGEADRMLAKQHHGDPAGYRTARARFDANRARNLSALSIAGIIGMLGTLWILFG
ncbi:hypothetical protein [Sphingomonas sp. LT1P40]|uniref:hypothetical protein n=1 Tax=Alteristakelama amylovorans TaxID=3096166 RepID=UPI002FCA283D